MANPYTLELITPERVEFRGAVVSVQLPGTEGSLQVLARHAPLMTSLEIGRLRVRPDDGTELDFATSGGFAEVRSNTLTVLAETVERADQIDVDRALRARSRAEERLRQRENVDFERAHAALLRALNRLRIAGKD
jgi:F-type H+-transporting ATPase subunit epsilon